MITRTVRISILFFCFIMFLNPEPLFAYGYGFYTNCGYGHLNMQENTGHRYQVGVGGIFDSNVSTDRFFHYRFSLGLTWNRTEHVAEDGWYTDHGYWRPDEPFDAEGPGIEMINSFGMGRFHTKRMNFWFGPSTRVHSDYYRKGEHESWRMHNFGIGIIVGTAFHLSERKTLTITASVHHLILSSSEDMGGDEMLFALQFDLLHTLERTPEGREQERLERERERLAEIQGRLEAISILQRSVAMDLRSGDSIVPGQTAPLTTSALNLVTGTLFPFERQTWFARERPDVQCRTVTIDTFPADAEILIGNRLFPKKVRRLVLQDLPLEQTDLVARFSDRIVPMKLDSDGLSIYCLVNGLTGATLVADLVSDRFIITDAESGVINDIQTGLQWAFGDTENYESWTKATDHCTSVRIGGHSDWRLPTVLELSVLVMELTQNSDRSFDDFVQQYPAISLPHGRYWTSTLGEHSAMRATESVAFVTFPEGEKDFSDPSRNYRGLPVRWNTEILNPLPPIHHVEQITQSEAGSTAAAEENANGEIDMIDENALTTLLVSSTRPLLVLFSGPRNHVNDQFISFQRDCATIYGSMIQCAQFSIPEARRLVLTAYYDLHSLPTLVLFAPQGKKLFAVGKISEPDQRLTPLAADQLAAQISAWIWATTIEPESGIFINGKLRSLSWENEKLVVHDGVIR